MRGGFRRAGRVVGIVMVLTMAVAVVSAWRLAQGPIVIPGLAARLARAMGSDDGATAVEIGSVELAWDTRQHEIDLLARDVRLARRGMPLLELPAVGLELALRPLLAGRIVLRAVELPNPRLTIARAPDGGLWIDADDTPGDDASVATLLVSLAHPLRSGPLAELRRLEVSGGVVTMAASADQPEWVLHDVSVTMLRGDGGLRIDAAGACAVEGRTMPLSVAGTVAPVAPDPTGVPAVAVDATAATPLVPRGDLARFWPGPLGADVRTWVLAHVRAGHARDLEMTLRGRFAAGAPAVFEAVEVRFDFDGMELGVADRLPVITGLRGRARGAPAGWSFEVARGDAGGLQVGRGSVEIDGSGVADPLVRVRATLRGVLPQALALVRALGATASLPAAGAAGTVDASVAFDAPLGQPVDLARMASVQGRLRDVTWRDVWGGRSLAAGDFALDVTKAQATLQGGARLADVPVQIVARQSLVSPAATLEATARLDARGRAALGFDGRPWLEGPTPLRATRTGDAIAVDADLRDAVLAVEALGMAKPAGTPGTAAARVVLRDGGIAAVDEARLDYGATRLVARGRFDAAGTLASGALDGVLGPVPGRETPSRIALRVSPGPAARAVTAETDDVDLLFRAAGIKADATGGALTFSGTLGTGPGMALDGLAEARAFRLASAPLLAQLLAMTSVPGLTTAFAERGLEVTRLAARIAHRTGRITLTDGTLESPSLGMRLAGTVDTVAGAVDLRGALVPSYYGLNTLAGRVPVLGRVLTGTHKEGLQVFEFTVRGSTAAPKIAVDPVSSLAPGAVRDLIKLLPLPGRAR